MAHTILVVDDSEAARREMVHALRQAGYDTVEAANGEQALTVAKERELTLIITDVHMPAMDGIEFCEALAAQMESTPPILVASTESNPELKIRAKRAGVKGWIYKPVDIEALIDVIQGLTGSHGA